MSPCRRVPLLAAASVRITPAWPFGISFGVALTGGMILPWAVDQLANAYGLRLALSIPAINAIMIFLLKVVLGKKTARGRRNETYYSEASSTSCLLRIGIIFYFISAFEVFLVFSKDCLIAYFARRREHDLLRRHLQALHPD